MPHIHEEYTSIVFAHVPTTTLQDAWTIHDLRNDTSSAFQDVLNKISAWNNTSCIDFWSMRLNECCTVVKHENMYWSTTSSSSTTLWHFKKDDSVNNGVIDALNKSSGCYHPSVSCVMHWSFGCVNPWESDMQIRKSLKGDDYFKRYRPLTAIVENHGECAIPFGNPCNSMHSNL